MSGVSRHTALMLQAHGDWDGEGGIRCEAAPQGGGKYAGWVSFWRDRRPHIAPLLSTGPIYDSPGDAEAAMKQVVADIRSLKI